MLKRRHFSSVRFFGQKLANGGGPAATPAIFSALLFRRADLRVRRMVPVW
jgi:hypothetical protein